LSAELTRTQVNATQIILYFFLGAGTLYTAADQEHRQTQKSSYKPALAIKRLDSRPLTLAGFLRPLSLAARPCVLLPSVAYAMVFLFASILISIEIPEIFPEKFSFDAQQIGLQNLAIIVGSGIGEVIGGRLSDQWMWYREKAIKRTESDGRLWRPSTDYGLVTQEYPL
jgi:hypothetical protein